MEDQNRRVRVPILENYCAPYKLEYDGKYVTLLGGDKNYRRQTYGSTESDQFEEMVLVPVVAEIRNAEPVISEITGEYIYIDLFDLKLQEKHINIIGHTLGVNVYHAKRSKFKKDKKLPKEFYRNRFCAGEGSSDISGIRDLVSMGHMKAGRVINDGRDTLYYITDEGISMFRKLFSELISK